MATPFLRFRIIGSIGNTDEWSVNPTFAQNAGPAAPTQSTLDAWVDAAADLNGGSLFPSALAGRMGAAIDVRRLRGEYYGEDGRLEVVSEYAYPTPLATGSGGQLPPQCAVVSTLLTGVIGRRTRGRLYWPLLGAQTVPATGRLATGSNVTIAAAVASLLGDIGDAYAAATILPCVRSEVGGTNQIVTEIRVGDVIDTQRRRRNKFVEQYATSPI